MFFLLFCYFSWYSKWDSVGVLYSAWVAVFGARTQNSSLYLKFAYFVK